MKQNMSQIRQRLSIYFFRKKSLLGNFSRKLLKYNMYCTHLTYHISLKGDTDCKVDTSCLGQHTNLKHIMDSNCTGLWLICLDQHTKIKTYNDFKLYRFMNYLPKPKNRTYRQSTLKVHKIEIFFGFDFEICIISLLVTSKY
jgi:hypothetical protein